MLLAIAVLILAALNLSVRLGAESVSEWDESMYALSAADMVASGDWVATTIHGELDYYNTKPPLNVWLIAASFTVFGKTLWSLRLASACAAWLTVLVVMAWTWRALGAAVALMAGIVLSTNFGFVHVHAGRSADPDALLTFVVLLIAVTLWASERVPRRLAWIGPLLATMFLLKGTAVFMGALLVLIVELLRRTRSRQRCVYLSLGIPGFLIPVGLWTLLRWRVDRWEFLRRVVYDDFVGHTMTVLDGHQQNLLYFVNLLHRLEYGWILAITVAIGLCPRVRIRLRDAALGWRDGSIARLVIWTWAVVVFLVPTLMRTKLPWYLNPFYPVFAVGTAWIIASALHQLDTRARQISLVATVVIVLLTAEVRLGWYSVVQRDLAGSSQGLLLSAQRETEHCVVYQNGWNNAELFVLRNLVNGEAQIAQSVDDFLQVSAVGDYLLWPTAVSNPGLSVIGSNGRTWLYRREALRRGLQ